ncbi:MAG: histidine--tRNA ligase [Spirochaetes bacterium]|nr:histidine--tRNA ligase [Spirochaetota bacterium]
MPFSNQPQKGMQDDFPWDMAVHNRVMGTIAGLLRSFHYEEYDAPVLEPLELFAAKSSEELVREQAYVLRDRGDRELVLRPEMTPTLARMVSQISRERPRPYRWYSIPKCFRFERPQKGRLREFRQLNVDLMGDDSVHSDLEMFLLVKGLMASFGLAEAGWRIRWNHRGALNALLGHRGFSADEQKAFYWLIDRVDKIAPEAFGATAAEKLPDAPKRAFLETYLANEDVSVLLAWLREIPETGELCGRLEAFQRLLGSVRLERAVYSPRTVRGLDYYTGLVFEVYAEGESIHRALFGGGRYDKLLDLYSNDPLSGIGFGMGIYIFSLFLEEAGKLPKVEAGDSVLVQPLGGEESAVFALQVAEALRAAGRVAEFSVYSGGVKKVFQKAEARGFTQVALVGDDEVREKAYSLKNLKTGTQEKIPLG